MEGIAKLSYASQCGGPNGPADNYVCVRMPLATPKVGIPLSECITGRFAAAKFRAAEKERKDKRKNKRAGADEKGCESVTLSIGQTPDQEVCIEVAEPALSRDGGVVISRIAMK